MRKTKKERKRIFFIKLKICIVIVLAMLLLNRAAPETAVRITEKIGIKKDYTVDEITDAAAGAYENFRSYISQTLEDAFSEPYTSSGGRT